MNIITCGKLIYRVGIAYMQPMDMFGNNISLSRGINLYSKFHSYSYSKINFSYGVGNGCGHVTGTGDGWGYGNGRGRGNGSGK